MHVENHQAQQELPRIDLIHGLETIVKMRRRIHMGAPLAWMAETLGMEAVLGNGKQRGDGLGCEALPVWRAGSESVSQIDELRALKYLERTLQTLRGWLGRSCRNTGRGQQGSQQRNARSSVHRHRMLPGSAVGPRLFQPHRWSKGNPAADAASARYRCQR